MAKKQSAAASSPRALVDLGTEVDQREYIDIPVGEDAEPIVAMRVYPTGGGNTLVFGRGSVDKPASVWFATFEEAVASM
jgi:hypothetical protein